MPLLCWFSARFPGRRTRAVSFSTAESLELRVVPTASSASPNLEISLLRDGVLRVRGDSDAAVHVSFIVSAQGMRVVGELGTTVNGQSEVFFENARVIRGRLGDGDDSVTVTESNSVSGVSVSLNLGDGNNQFSINTVLVNELSLTSGNGKDTFDIANVGIGSLTMKMGSGNDSVRFFHSSVDVSTNLSARDEALFEVIGSRFGSRPRLQNVTLV